METVRLKNGTEEAKQLVVITIAQLKELMSSEPIAFYELVMLCRDRDHELFGNAGEKLEKSGLLQREGVVHDSIRNIVVSAVEGDMLNMRITSPIKA